MTSKEIKEAAKGACRERLASPDDYWLTPDEMQSFEEAIINEYQESILNQLEADAENDNLGTLESVLISVGNAKKPTTV